jgi:dTDP-4-dehydrorhamnose reductase
MKTTYLIIGAEGQLGREFAETLIEADRTGIAPAEKDCSIIDRDRIARVVDDTQPDVIINCAAYNAVDAAEADPETAFKVNSLAVADLARICSERHIRLVHFGSDYVFDGQKQALYVEADPPHPLNVYGQSKLDGEQAVLSLLPDALVFRLSWVIGRGKQNFLYKLAGWAEKNPVLKISADEVSVPTFTDDIVKLTIMALDQGLTGLFHLTGGGYASRYELARYYAEKTGLPNLIVPVAMSTFPSKARRPLFAAMDNRRLTDTLKVDIGTWKTGVDRYAKRGQRPFTPTPLTVPIPSK